MRQAALAAVLLVATARIASASSEIERLIAAYPDHLSRAEAGDLVWRDGTRMRISDGAADKTFDVLLERPDIDDMFRIPYRAGPMRGEPGLNEDPGRIRHEPFFRKMYGDCGRGEVQGRLRAVRWMPGRGGSVQVTTVNGVAERLEAVVRDLERLPERFMRFLTPSAGTFNCRFVEGTRQRSMHAYGAAIDLNVQFAHYWRWSRGAGGRFEYKNLIPFEIVEIFERHGFIWGGKWSHFDTMHFEYRPELLTSP